MVQEYQVFIEASVCCYHAHFRDATVFIGEVLTCEREPASAFDKYAVAIKNEAGHMVEHVPKELSKVFNKFLKDYSEIKAECIGNRYNAGQGKGLELPVDFRLLGSALGHALLTNSNVRDELDFCRARNSRSRLKQSFS